ncbi:hypothetical protein GCM10007977_109170 [Dactylosporangium sucinum]|uniref:Uncharacterized protein n=1 Tax=Dactylosporangium sucinum TaxID=1424081 RepID=A0A917UI99_9ACTN|nr:hypothetical protein [Dactylosporangium sucinum]GGM89308.1 hypothetical protein GCM10007977_109170 [Dactylosporangium sucinum]
MRRLDQLVARHPGRTHQSQGEFIDQTSALCDGLVLGVDETEERIAVYCPRAQDQASEQRVDCFERRAVELAEHLQGTFEADRRLDVHSPHSGTALRRSVADFRQNPRGGLVNVVSLLVAGRSGRCVM